MDTLRIVLIVLGVVLLVGIYFVDRWKRNHARARHEAEGEMPASEIDDDSLSSFSAGRDALPDEWVGKAVTLTPRRHEQIADEHLEGLKGLERHAARESVPAEPKVGATVDDKPGPALPGDEDKPEPALPDDVVILTVMAGEGKRFRGPVLLRVLQETGLEHGSMEIFHYHASAHDTPLFSVANILEPGSFHLDEMTALETPGLAIFMRLPTVLDGEQALAVMLQKSRQMAARLSGTLCDERHRPLDETSLAALQARVLPYMANV